MVEQEASDKINDKGRAWPDFSLVDSASEGCTSLTVMSNDNITLKILSESVQVAGLFLIRVQF